MLDEQIDSVITDSIVSESDSVVFPISLLRESVSWKPFLPFDTLTNQVELVEGIPLSGEKMNIEFISSILIYTVVYRFYRFVAPARKRFPHDGVHLFFQPEKRGQLTIGRWDSELFLCFLVG